MGQQRTLFYRQSARRPHPFHTASAYIAQDQPAQHRDRQAARQLSKSSAAATPGARIRAFDDLMRRTSAQSHKSRCGPNFAQPSMPCTTATVCSTPRTHCTIHTHDENKQAVFGTSLQYSVLSVMTPRRTSKATSLKGMYSLGEPPAVFS